MMGALMASEIKTEKLFWAAQGDSEVSTTFGPFGSAEEAESHTRRLGWRWVSVWNRKSDEFGTVLDLTKRFYEVNDLNTFGQHETEVDSYRDKLIAAKQAAGAYGSPLNEDEAKFFAAYEEQMSTPTTYACAECGEDIESDNLHDVPVEHMDGTKEILHFHASFKTCCPLKWGAKRLSASADKLQEIVKIYDAIKAELRNGR
jgi:hypothetical protein